MLGTFGQTILWNIFSATTATDNVGEVACIPCNRLQTANDEREEWIPIQNMLTPIPVPLKDFPAQCLHRLSF
jgi:hypothetical protein